MEISRLTKERDRQIDTITARIKSRGESQIRRLKKSSKEYQKRKTEIESEMQEQAKRAVDNIRRRFERRSRFSAAT